MATRGSSQVQDCKILTGLALEHLGLLYCGKELNGTCLHMFNYLAVNHGISPSAFKTHLPRQADEFLLGPALLLIPKPVGEWIQKSPLSLARYFHGQGRENSSWVLDFMSF